MSCQAAKGKLPKEERCKQNDNCTRNVHPSFANFQPGLGVNVHILLTQNWLWESSLSLLSLWCILFQIKLCLFRENLNLKKHWGPKNGWSSPSTFWHRLVCVLLPGTDRNGERTEREEREERAPTDEKRKEKNIFMKHLHNKWTMQFFWIV